MGSREMTPKQRERQDHRDRASGRYADVNPCDLCQRSVGVDYYSTKYTDSTFTANDGTEQNFADLGLTLHEDCCLLLDEMTAGDAYDFMFWSLEERRKVLTARRRAKSRKGATA